MAKGYAEALALIEAGKQMALAQKPEKTTPPKKEKPEKPPSWEQLWLEEQQRRAKFDDFMKVLKKQLAEEPKKDDKKAGWSVDTIAMVLMAIMPVNWLVIWLLMK